MSYYVYKYVLNDEIVYIGMTNDIIRRVNEHSSGIGLEAKFVPYSDAEIYYHKCGNETEMAALETLLINYYKPILNDIDIEPGLPTVTFDVSWTKYNPFDTRYISNTEREYRNCLKQINANNTRIAAYEEAAKLLTQQISKARQFYIYLENNKEFITQHHDSEIGIKDDIFIEGPIWIGQQLIDKWYDSFIIDDKTCWVKLSGDFLCTFFGVSSNKGWIDETVKHIKSIRLDDVTVRMDGLRYKNQLLKQNADALEKELYGKL